MKVTKEPMEVLKCHECQKSFINKKTLGDHIRHTHNKEKEKNKKCGILLKWERTSMILMVNMWRLCTTAYKAMKTPESSRWSETLAQIVT